MKTYKSEKESRNALQEYFLEIKKIQDKYGVVLDTTSHKYIVAKVYYKKGEDIIPVCGITK